MRDRIRKWLGITDLLEESARWNRELTHFSVELGRLRDEDLRLRQLVAEKFSDLAPASPLFIDSVRQQLELKIDMTMNACDRIVDELRRQHGN